MTESARPEGRMLHLPSGRLRSAVQAVALGMVVGLLSLAAGISYTSIIWTGEMASWRDQGLGMILCGSLIYSLTGAFFGSLRGVWWGSNTLIVVVTGIAVSGIAAALPDAAEGVRVATATAFIALATAFAGFVCLAVGVARFGQHVKAVPYPVIGGFMAATGAVLVIRSAEIVAGTGAGAADLLASEPAMRWLPHVAGGVAMFLVAKKSSPLIAMGLSFLAYPVVFHAWLTLSDQTWQDAQAAGLLLAGSFGTGPFLPVTPAAWVGAADGATLFAAAPLLLAIAGLTLLVMLVNSTSIEFITNRNIDLDADYRTGGIAMSLAALGGGTSGIHSATLTAVMARVFDRPSPAVCVSAAGLLGSVAAFGLGPLAWMPLGAFAVLLCFMGVELLWTWLVVARRDMSAADYALVLAICATSLVFGFVTALAVGLVAASLMFTMAYSRVDVLRSRVSGRLRLSPTERSEQDIETLLARGRSVAVFELQGYLFFGTASRLHDRIAAEIAGPDSVVRTLIVDFRRVVGMDISTAFVFARMAGAARQLRVELAFTQVPVALSRNLGRAFARGAVAFPTLADALAEYENRILAEAAPVDGGTAGVEDLASILASAERAGVPLGGAPEPIAANATLFAAGEPGDSIVLLVSGRLSAWIERGSGGVARVATFLPGAIVGEIGFCTGGTRTASVVAETDCMIRRITRADLDRTAAVAPDLAAAFHAVLAALLAKRLGRTTALLHAVEG